MSRYDMPGRDEIIPPTKENITIPEKEPRYPSLEEIKNQIKQFSGEQKLEVVRTKEDEKGIFLHEEIYVNENGDTTLYTYARIKPHLQSDGVTVIVATLETAYFNGKLEDNDCFDGNGLADYSESGEWQLNK